MPLWQILAVLWPFAAVVAALILGDTVRTADAHTAPAWPSGDEAWLADQPFDCLSRDEQVKRLEAWL